MKGFSTMSLKWVNPRAGVLALTTSLVSGCTTVHNIEGQGSTPVPVETALRQLETDLSRVPALVPSNLLLPLDDKTNKWQTTPESNEIRHILAESQCFDLDADGKEKPERRKRNPLVPVGTGALQLTVQGQLSEGGTLTIAAAPSLAGTVTRQTQPRQVL